MKVKVVIYEAEEGGYWAEVPGMPGCYSEGETLDEVKHNIAEAIEGILSIEDSRSDSSEPRQVYELEI